MGIVKGKKKKTHDTQMKSTGEAPAMNEELKEWINETQLKTPLSQSDQKPVEPQKIEPTGKCHVCEKNLAKFTCVRCGAPTCTSCYFTMIGLCKNCLSKYTADKWKGQTPNWERTLGVQWID